MRSVPRKLPSEADLYAAALRALARRAYSISEMCVYLEHRAVSPEMVQQVIARLRQETLIDDARYAAGFARQHANIRRQGPHRIACELHKRGVPDRHVEAALREVFAETDEALLVRTMIERRLRAAAGPLDQRRTASLYRALQRAGFDLSLIRRELRAARTDATSLPQPSDQTRTENEE
jgi:regulatory protein